MTYKQSTGETIETAFLDFHQKNPDVYKEFSKLAFEAIKAGKRKLSSKMIINVIRWNISLKTKTNDGFKINDAFTAYYARLFMQKNPTWYGIFNTRRLRST